MQIAQKWLFRLTGVVLLLILIIGGAGLFNNRLITPQTAQVSSDPDVVAPTEASPPAPIIIGTVEPTPTTIPTWTPLPTPTRIPGPTATPLPLATIAQDNHGAIHYAVDSENADLKERRHFFLSTNANGDVEGERQPAKIPAELGFVPSQVFPSPNQQYTIYMQAVEPGGRPAVYNQITGHISVLFEDSGGGRFLGWHPDGRRFLFWIDSAGLWLIDAETLDMVTLAYPAGPLQGASISPDGLTVAYIADNEANNGDALWLVSTAGSDAKSLPILGEALYLYSAAWSPDSTQLLYFGACNTAAEINAAGLCIVNVKAQEQKVLDVPYAGFAPVWSPDGRFIASTGITPGEEACQPKTPDFALEKCLYQARSIYVTDLEARKSSVLTPGLAPVWSPTGSTIAFLSNRTGKGEIWAVRLDTQGAYQLTAEGQSIVPDSLTWAAEAK
jgi:Tol biopolymer transport system component